MKINIDLKSLFLGLLAGVVVMLVVAAQSPQTNGVGRYQITGSLNYFMIVDTQTGRVWSQNLPNNSTKESDPGFFTAKQ